MVTSRLEGLTSWVKLRTKKSSGRDETRWADPVVGLRGFVAVDSVREGA